MAGPHKLYLGVAELFQAAHGLSQFKYVSRLRHHLSTVAKQLVCLPQSETTCPYWQHAPNLSSPAWLTPPSAFSLAVSPTDLYQGQSSYTIDLLICLPRYVQFNFVMSVLLLSYLCGKCFCILSYILVSFVWFVYLCCSNKRLLTCLLCSLSPFVLTLTNRSYVYLLWSLLHCLSLIQ